MTQNEMTPGVVVVGVDGSAHADAALRYALEEAACRDTSLRAVTACRPPEMWMFAYDVYVAPDPAKTRAAARADVKARVEEVRAQLGSAVADVAVEPVAAIGSPVEVLLEAARDAELLVVGHRGRGAWRSALLGSVGLGVLLQAPCPVTIVQPPRDDVHEHLAPAGHAAPPLPIGPIA